MKKQNYPKYRLRKFSRSPLVFLVLFLALVVAPLIFANKQSAQAVVDATIFFNPSSRSINIGDTFTLVARVNPGTAGTANEVGGVELDVTYDETVMRLDSITRSASFNYTIDSVIDNVTGVAVFDALLMTSPATYVTATSDVATFSFTALASATNSPVSFAGTTMASAHGSNILASTTGATVTVAEASGDTPPVLTENTPVSTPASDDTPSLTFSSDVAGDVTYTGSCTGNVATVLAATPTAVTFSHLNDGTYADCKIRVTDGDGHYSTLTATSFTIDTVAPTILSVSSEKTNGTYTIGEVIDIDVTFSEAITSSVDFTVTLETGATDRTCTFSVSNSADGSCNYTVQPGDTSLDLTTSLIAGTAADQVGNAMANFAPTTNLAANKALVIDTTAPVINTPVEVTPDPTSDPTPDYGFTSDEAGTILYAGTCAAGNTVAASGANTVTFGTLTSGTYADCTIRVEDAAGNISNTLNVGSFVVDVTAPVRSNGAPTGNLAEGTTNTDISLDTNENATCKYSTMSGVAYASMTNTFGTTGTTTHSTNVTGLSDGTSYIYYVRCVDDLGNADGTDYSISFGVADNTAPVLAEVTPVTTPTSDSTPDYVFSSDEAGTISYGGDCDSEDVDAIAGDNTITFDTLSNGTYSNCTITVTDGSSNPSLALAVTPFTVNATDNSDDALTVKIDGEKYKFGKSDTIHTGSKKVSFKGENSGLAGGTVKIYSGGDLKKEINVGSDGKWSTSIKVKNEKDYKFKIEYYNSSGEKIAESKKYSVEVDTEDPKFTDLPLLLNKRKGDKVWWKAEDNKKIENYKIKFLGKTKTTTRDYFNIPADAPWGPHILNVRAYDEAGNSTSRIVTIWVR
jgi:hypothetical protein